MLELRPALLHWFDRHRRHLPWRQSGGKRDPYAVWLSEIMLQQTTVVTVIPYYRNFLTRWPTVDDLARASLDQVLSQWAGLGYYARARNLKACAERISAEFGGCFPNEVTDLIELPGVGPYTAAAIAAIAFGRPVVPVDGNVERVIARLFAVDQPLPKAKVEIASLAQGFAQVGRAGACAEALIELGALVCTPRDPNCPACPLARKCEALKLGLTGELPKRAAKKQRPVRHSIARLLVNDGAIALVRRPCSGLLGGMLELPGSLVFVEANEPAEPGYLPGEVKHIFTHFELRTRLLVVMPADAAAVSRHDWYPLDNLEGLALPALTAKLIRHGQAIFAESVKGSVS